MKLSSIAKIKDDPTDHKTTSDFNEHLPHF